MNDVGEITGYTLTLTLLPCSIGEDCGTWRLVGTNPAGEEATCAGTERLIDVKLLPPPGDPSEAKLTFVFLDQATSSSGLRYGCAEEGFTFLVPNADGTISLRGRIAGYDEFSVEGTLHRVDAVPSPSATP